MKKVLVLGCLILLPISPTNAQAPDNREFLTRWSSCQSELEKIRKSEPNIDNSVAEIVTYLQTLKNAPKVQCMEFRNGVNVIGEGIGDVEDLYQRATDLLRKKKTAVSFHFKMYDPESVKKMEIRQPKHILEGLK